MAEMATYRFIEEDSDDRTVLRARRIGPLVGGALLSSMAAVVLLFVVVAAREGDRVALLLGVPIGLLMLLMGALALVRGLRGGDRIVFDHQERVVRLGTGKPHEELAVPYSSIRSFSLAVVRRASRERDAHGRTYATTLVTHQVRLATTAGDRFLVDHSGDSSEMEARAETLAKRCRVKQDRESDSASRRYVSGRRQAPAELRIAEPERPPRRVRVDRSGPAAAYRWTRAPWSLSAFLLVLLSGWVLVVLTGGLVAVALDKVSEGSLAGGAYWSIPGLALAYVTYRLVKYVWTTHALVASPERLEYTARALGLPLSESRVCAGSMVVGLPILCPELGKRHIEVLLNAGRPFSIPMRGFSLRDLAWLQRRWASDLGLLGGSG
jgi:hypothetical protein